MTIKGILQYSVVYIGLLLYSTASLSADSQLREKCEAWLSEHYQNYSHVKTIREYKQESEYNYRANYRVVPYSADPTTIGFDCTIYLEKDKVVAVPSLKPYLPEQKRQPTKVKSSLQERRMKWGGDACPKLKAWKRFSDEVRKGNYSAKLAKSCIWLEKGYRVFGPEKTVKYNKSPFALISLPNGKRYWVEGGNL